MKIGRKLKAVLFGTGRRIIVTGVVAALGATGVVSAEKAGKLEPVVDAILTVASALA